MLDTPLMLAPEPATQVSGPASKCPRCGTLIQSGVACACGAPNTASLDLLPLGASLESAVREIVVGDVFADTYQVVKKLGEGGMGTVFLARDVSLEREVAVKVLARHLCADAAALERFVFEAKMTAKLDHPNIVAVHAVGTFHERPFIVMKLLEGLSLSELVKRRREPWPWADVRPLFQQLCLGLSYLHGQKLVHRDVKPSNVNVGPNGHVTLLDFGILKDTSRERTVSGVLLGTVRYMAPEQIMDPSRVDARADLYALGLIAWLLLAGKPAFSGDDMTVAQRKLSEDPPDPRTMNPALPKAVAEVLTLAVHRDPQKRYQSAEAVFAALDEAFAAPELAPPPRAPVSRFAAAGVGLALVGGLGLWFATRPAAVPTEVAPLVTPASSPAIVATNPAANTPPAEPPAAAVVPAGVVQEPVAAPVPEPAPVRTTKRAPIAKPAGSAKLSVVSMVAGKPSYAEVFVDGTSRGESPTQLELPAGSHKIRLTREGFQPWEGMVKVVAGKPDRLVVELRGAKP